MPTNPVTDTDADADGDGRPVETELETETEGLLPTIEAELEADELADALAAKPLPMVDKVVQDDVAGAG